MIRNLSALVVAGLLVGCAQAPVTAVKPAPAAAQPVQTNTHASRLGFSIDLPASWMILSQQEMKENAGLFDPGNPIFAKVDKNALFLIKQKIESGSMEMYVSSGMGGGFISDNITVIKQIGRSPSNDTEAAQLCGQLPALYAKETGAEIKFLSCGYRNVSGLNALHIVAVGLKAGTTTVQYFLQKSANTLLIFTGTFGGDGSETMQAEFDGLMQSVKVTQ